MALAAQRGCAALAITDGCWLAGVVRAHIQAERQPRLHLIVGCETRWVAPPAASASGRGLREGTPAEAAGGSVPGLMPPAQTRRVHGNLSQWFTVAPPCAERVRQGALASDVDGRVPHAPFLAGLPDRLALLVPQAGQWFESQFAQALWLKTLLHERVFIAIELLHAAACASWRASCRAAGLAPSNSGGGQ